MYISLLTQLVRVVQLIQVKLQTSNISIHNHRPEDNSSVSSNSSKSSQKRNIHLNISIHNHRPKDNSSVSSNSSKSSYTHQTYLYTIAGQRTTRPCRPTRPSQVTHIKHIYTQLQARGQLVRVVQLVQVKSEEKYTFKHFYTQSLTH